MEVIFGTQKKNLSLEPTFDPDTGLGTPGDYRAWFIPTSPGTYTFHFTGTIGGQTIDQSFTSGPTTFDTVADPTDVEFPAKVPTGTAIAQRLDREFPRIGAQLAAARTSADDKAGSAKTLAYVGIGLGAIGLILGAAALVMARRGRPVTP